jgi:hypothetical protein
MKDHSDSPHKYSEADFKGVLGFLVDNIDVVFEDQGFQHSVHILWALTVFPYFQTYSYKAEYVQKLQIYR